jgi:hypothetical protein
MPHREGANMKTRTLVDRLRLPRLRRLLHDNLVVDVHLEDVSTELDELFDSRRADNVERFVPLDLSRKHKNTRESRDVIGVCVANKYSGDLLPLEIELPQRHLGSFAAIE